MRSALIAAVAALAIHAAAGGSLAAQASPPAAPTAKPAAAKPAAAPKVARVSGAVVSVDTTAKTLVVKAAGKQSHDMTFGVDEHAAGALAGLKAGDRVALRYVDEAGRLTAKSIVKTAAPKTAKAATGTAAATAPKPAAAPQTKP